MGKGHTSPVLVNPGAELLPSPLTSGSASGGLLPSGFLRRAEEALPEVPSMLAACVFLYHETTSQTSHGEMKSFLNNRFLQKNHYFKRDVHRHIHESQDIGTA